MRQPSSTAICAHKAFRTRLYTEFICPSSQCDNYNVYLYIYIHFHALKTFGSGCFSRDHALNYRFTVYNNAHLLRLLPFISDIHWQLCYTLLGSTNAHLILFGALISSTCLSKTRLYAPLHTPFVYVHHKLLSSIACTDSASLDRGSFYCAYVYITMRCIYYVSTTTY